VLDQAEEHRRLLGAAWVLITNEHGVLVARTDYPTEFDIDLSRGALIANALSGDETSGAWLDERRRKLFMAVAVPLRASPQAAPQGSLVAAYAIDDTLAHQIKQATTTDVVFFALDTLNRPYIVGSTLPREAVEPALVADTAAMVALGRDSAGTELAADVDGEHLIGLASSIRSAGGDAFGGFVAFRSHYRGLGGFRAGQDTIGFARALGPLLALAWSFVLGRRIAGPIRRLGMGGMGVVYRAFDRELQEAVAIKTLRPEALAGDGVALERFKQEIRLARKIAHRNVVRTHDLGEVNGMYYLTMEYVEGTSLKQ